jgi:hypothetical protein
MIISNKHSFVFVHIPKCAGTTVRSPLKAFDDCNGAYTGRVDNHPDLGNLDYVHIPLFTLKEYFEGEFKSIKDYWSFAVVRDPFARFGSSVSQHLKKYSDRPLHKCSPIDIKIAIDSSIDYLSRQPRDNHCLPPEYIHFQKQIDYIELNSEQLVDSLYTVNEIDLLLEEVGKYVGQSLNQDCKKETAVTRANQSIVFRNDVLRWITETARPLTNQISLFLPKSAKRYIRDTIYVPRDERMKAMFSAGYVQDFVRSYYVEDIALYKKVEESFQAKAS